jgi:biopolymer transport protein ExbD
MSMIPAQVAANLTPDAEETVVGHKSARMKRDLPPAKMQLNLTSMIDVIFQLLIYFVITANFTMDEGVLTARLPEEGNAPQEVTLEPPSPPLFITVQSSGLDHYRIGLEGFPETPNDFAGLQRMLRDLRITGTFDAEKKPIVIKPDAQVRWQHVVNAFNAAVGAEYKRVSFATATQ